MAHADLPSETQRSKQMRDWIQLGVVAFVALSGTYQFVFKDIVRPAKEPTALEIDARLEQVGERDGMVLVRAVVTTVNPSNRRIYVPAFWFDVVGVRLHAGADPGSGEHATPKPEDLETVYSPVAGRELVAQQRIVTTASAWWDPKDRTRDEAVFAIPSRKFDYLRMRVRYLHTRYGEDLMDPAWVRDANRSWEADFRLKDGSDAVAWQMRTASGVNWAVTTLPLWESARELKTSAR